MIKNLSTPGRRSAATKDPACPAWNDTCRDFPSDTCLHHLIQQQASRCPDQVALIYGDQSLTYREVWQRTNQLARFLLGQGVGPETLVGVLMERSIELPLALLGVLKAGAAYVPLDPDYPIERLGHMIDDGQPPIVLTQDHLVPFAEKFSGVREAAIDLVVIDDGTGDIASHSVEDVEDSAGPDNLAYVIFTSGSTGPPKGAMNTHRAICNRLLWMQEEYGLSASDTVLQKTPASFDVSVWEFFLPLIAGARMVLARPKGHLDSNYLCDLIETHQVTMMHFVPSMLRVFLQEPGLQRCASLRDVICSGEALSVDLQNQFFERMGACLHNLYGPTEAAVDVTYWECRRDEPLSSVPIGRPVANTQIHLLDESLNPVPVGDAGELHIGGVQVARGYLNRPELTRAKFIPDPFSANDEARLYKTGDLARYLPDGNIEFLGRIDHQVKIRGFRIELTEIEAVLTKHPSVRFAAVAAKEYGAGDRRLIAYLVPSEDDPSGAQDQGELIHQARAAVQKSLPEYMTPSVFMVLDKLPMTASGKLDRRSLPDPPRSRPRMDQPFVLPRNDLEQRLAEKWSEILQLEEVGIHDLFFELGGDSLRAAEFVNWLQKELDEFIYVVTIFQAPTIAQFAELLQRDYAESARVWLGITEESTSDSVAKSADAARIDDQTLREFRSVIPAMESFDSSVHCKNPRAVFILAPPRSGTTLLRVMLAGHPRLFSATELQLLCFNTLAERRAAFSGKHSAWLEGAIRAVMELRQCDADEAKALIGEYEDQDLTTKDFYGHLQNWAEGRLLVDKSPHYALDEVALRKAEHDFDDPFYIHLVRHPYSMVRSFENQHMDQILYLKEHEYSARQLGEMVWTVSHQNITAFLADVPASRQFQITFENLTHQPSEFMHQLCSKLGIEFHQGVLNPYGDQDKKMVDGIYTASTPMGDVNFLRHKRIDPDVADRWKAVKQDDFLGGVTWQVAQQLGYQPQDVTSIESEHWSEQKSVAQGRRKRQSQRRSVRMRSRRGKAE